MSTGPAHILLVEDSNMYGRLTKSKIEKAFDLPVIWCKTLAETAILLAKSKGNVSMALLDFNLPDMDGIAATEQLAVFIDRQPLPRSH